MLDDIQKNEGDLDLASQDERRIRDADGITRGAKECVSRLLMDALKMSPERIDLIYSDPDMRFANVRRSLSSLAEYIVSSIPQDDLKTIMENKGELSVRFEDIFKLVVSQIQNSEKSGGSFVGQLQYFLAERDVQVSREANDKKTVGDVRDIEIFNTKIENAINDASFALMEQNPSKYKRINIQEEEPGFIYKLIHNPLMIVFTMTFKILLTPFIYIADLMSDKQDNKDSMINNPDYKLQTSVERLWDIKPDHHKLIMEHVGDMSYFPSKFAESLENLYDPSISQRQLKTQGIAVPEQQRFASGEYISQTDMVAEEQKNIKGYYTNLVIDRDKVNSTTRDPFR